MKSSAYLLTIFFVLMWCCCFTIAAQDFSRLEGTIVDETGEPLIGATILVHELNKGTSTDFEGNYQIERIKRGRYHLHITHVGYEATTEKIEINGEDTRLDITLQSSSIELKSVFVEANPFKSGPIEQSQTIEVVDRDYLEKNLAATFVNSLEKLPGLNAINTGVGIAKPVIRGMSFNRIMVNDNGIKQEGQQWGADHGLEIDMFDVDRVEIVKGPASLLYGSDAMGGVINIAKAPFASEGSFNASVLGIHKTNNNLRGTSAMFEGNKRGVVFKGRFSMQDFDNYQVPAETFNYAGYVLPIYQNRLRNTAGQERNFSIMTGLKKDWGYSTITVSRFSQRVGLFPGAIGIPTAYQLQRYDALSSIDLPRQDNEHWKVIWNNNILIGKNWLEVDLGYQHNIRREESFPENHGQAPSDGSLLALGLNLETFTANARYHTRINDKWKGIHGVQLQHMQNRYQGFEFLLPAFQTQMAGAYSFYEYSPKNTLTLNAGMRLDGGRHNISEHLQPIFRNYRPTGEFDQRNADIERDYMNLSGSLGASWLPFDKWNVKLNLGSSFRMPTAIELASNGVHHGTFRHELGNENLTSERGYQADLNISYSGRKFYFGLTPYAAFYEDYIYLAPTSRFTRLPTGSQVTWEFRQANSTFTGAELKTEYHFIDNLHVGLAADYVRTYNLDYMLPLPLTPPPSVMADVEYTFKSKWKWLSEGYINVFVREFAGQDRVDRNERVTPGYTLVGGNAGISLSLWGQPVDMMVGVENLTNEFYLNHMSRYRLLNLPEQGRNIIFSLKIPVSGKL